MLLFFNLGRLGVALIFGFLNFRFIDSDVLFDLFGETHLREVSNTHTPSPGIYVFSLFNQKSLFLLVISWSETITYDQKVTWWYYFVAIVWLILYYILNYLVLTCKLVKGVPVPLRHKIFTHMRRVEFSINYSAFRDFKQVSLQE